MKKDVNILKTRDDKLFSGKNDPNNDLIRVHLTLTRAQWEWAIKCGNRIGFRPTEFVRAFIDRYQLQYEEEHQVFGVIQKKED